MISSNESLSMLADSLASRSISELTDMSEIELSMLFGFTVDGARRMLATFEFAKRFRTEMIRGSGEKVIVKSPEDAAKLFEHIRYENNEHFVVCYLNTKNMVLGVETISIGSLNASIVHPREVFNRAIRRSAASIVCAHNHPSADPTPSPEDIQLTGRLKEAGELIGIDVLDHLILGGETAYVSLKERGLF
jgi:DNA repair protein RadC